MKLPQALILLALAAPSISNADEVEYRLNIGLYTEHYLGRSSELNENNRLVQFTAAKDTHLVTAASFVNSHYKESYLLGYGREKQFSKNFRGGASISIIHGYEGEIMTHYEGLLFAPTLFFNYHGVSLNIIPAAYILGYEFKL